MKEIRIKAIDSGDLEQLVKFELKDRYSFSIADTFLDRLDPSGTHVIAFAMPYEDDKHIRACCFLKTRDQDTPIVDFQDMTWETYNSLRDLERTEHDVKVAGKSLTVGQLQGSPLSTTP